ncbi:MAG TPA: serine/threonine-protein kinase [Kofleriaceae bacterium]|nr:serine/threonine-protein kinase [Kofleriaceae bacterium]
MPLEPEPGHVIGGRYELVEKAGRGGMADVWRSHVRGDFGFRRILAVKQMHTALAEQEQYVKMFVEEARLGSVLESPNIAEVRDFVAEDGNYYIVMEWIDGVDLGSWIKWHIETGQVPRWELVAAIGVGILRGLAAAHERSENGSTVPIVHRDVSPHNVLLTTRGMVKLIDFGLALAADRPTERTEPGIVKGKMAYLSPEIVTGGKPVPASDQFACGSVLWETLVGKKLFDGATDYETYTRVRDCQVPPLRPIRGDVPAAFIQIVMRALSAQPEQRFPSSREMARQIGTVMKKVTMRRDMHTVLARSVADARAAVSGIRVQEASEETPVADFREFTPPVEKDRRGLWHKLPFFGRRRG